MTHFYVLTWDANSDKITPYDIMPYLVRCYEKKEDKPKTYTEFKKFILDNIMYMWWSRCQYEILISDWSCQKYTEKIDVHTQVKMNIDVIVPLFITEVTNKDYSKND